MKPLLPIITLIFAANFLWAQQNLPQPAVWLQAESASGSGNLWHNQVADENHAVFSAEIIPYQANNFNYNPSITIDSSQYFTTVLNTLFSQGADVIIVYETSDTLNENGLWCLQNDSMAIGLTSQRIVNHDGAIPYRDDNQKHGIIHYLTTSWNNDFSSPATSLKIGSADSLFLNGKIAEVLYFDHRQQDTTVNQWCTYLAVKYGITLIETNYLTSNKHCVWNYEEFPTYSHCIAGIGRDDSLGLHQKQSYFAHKKITLGLGAIANSNLENSYSLQNNDFIIMGMDENGLETLTPLYLQNGETHLTMGNTRVQVTQNLNSEYSTFLHLHNPEFIDTTLICALLIDRSGTGNYPISETEIYYPTLANENAILYNNIVWDNDGNGHDVFCFSILNTDSLPLQDLALAMKNENENNSKGSKTLKNENIITKETLLGSQNSSDNNNHKSAEKETNQLNAQYHLYPNPTAGTFTLEAFFASPQKARITLWSTEGKLLKRWQKTKNTHISIEHFVSTPGNYFLEIVSDTEEKTLKLIVN